MPANTLGTANAIKTIVQALQLNGQPAYTSVVVGALKDIVEALPSLEITASDDETERATMGPIGGSATVADTQTFYLTSIVDYTDAQAAEAQLFALRDLLTEAFHASTHLNSTPGVIMSQLQPTGKYGYVFRNGQWYRMHQILLAIRYDYTTTLTA